LALANAFDINKVGEYFGNIYCSRSGVTPKNGNEGTKNDKFLSAREAAILRKLFRIYLFSKTVL
jgi:hypothetical protein